MELYLTLTCYEACIQHLTRLYFVLLLPCISDFTEVVSQWLRAVLKFRAGLIDAWFEYNGVLQHGKR